MKIRKAARTIVGVLLVGIGFWLALRTPYRERTYLIDAGGCRMETTIVDKPVGAAQGSVVLFHGISANKKIMSYLARGFAEAGLRVYAPDFPGHGRTAGPFSAARVEQCGEALVRELLARGMLTPQRTILAGHSMGGVAAVRIASRVPVAGVIAISPAPTRATHGVSAEMLLFPDAVPLAPNSLVVSGGLEPESMRGNAADLAGSRNDGTTNYVVIPGATHVSLLFGAATVRAARDWCARALHLPSSTNLPSHRPLIGFLAGFAGLLLIAGPFLREAVGKNRPKNSLRWTPASLCQKCFWNSRWVPP
jgi:pimeloyl-ACP methyl ester carboxylesterase